MACPLSPHDKFFRNAMSDPRVAEEFFKEHLPESIQKIIDWKKLELQKDSFVSDNLSLQIADMLYKTKFDRKDGFLYILIEHQTQPEKIMPFRMVKYMVEIMEKYRNKLGGGTYLPTIYPVIFYAGNKPYNYSTDLFSLFEENEAFMRQVFSEPFQLIDVNKIDDAVIRKRVWSGIMLYTMKHIFDNNFLPYLENMLPELKIIEKKDGKGYICTIFNYICGRGEIRDRKVFEQIVKKGFTPKIGDEIMTLADIYRNEGYEAGIQKGVAKGVLEGIAEGEAKGRAEGRAEGGAEGRAESGAEGPLAQAKLRDADCRAEWIRPSATSGMP